MLQQIRLNGPQTQARRRFTDGNVQSLIWGRGGGKSWFLLLCVFLLIAAWDGKQRPTGTGVRIVIALPVLAQGRKTLIARFRAAIRGLDPTLAFARALGGVLNEVELRCVFPGGSWVQFVSQEQEIPGIRCDAIFVDEGDDVKQHFFNSILSPFLSEPHSLRLRMVVGTPRMGRYGLLYALHSAAQRKAPRIFTSHHTWRAFPEHVDQAFALAERARAIDAGKLPGFEREWEVNFDAGEGLIYSMFDRALHVREAPKGARWTEFLVGVDHGWEHPGCFLLIGVLGNGDDAELYVIKEWYRSHEDETWWCQQVAEVLKLIGSHQHRWYADPSQPARINALRRHGARLVESTDVNNKVEDGIQAVIGRFAPKPTGLVAADGKTLLRRPRLYVSPTCVNTIRELGLYKRKADKNNPDVFTDEIIKKNDDAMDALRYPIVSRFGVPPNRSSQEGAGWE